MNIKKIEYRVIPVTRFHVTRYEDSGSTGSVTQRGEYDNADIAYEVGYALCKAEHERLGLPIGDERIQYPTPVYSGQAKAVIAAGALPNNRAA